MMDKYDERYGKLSPLPGNHEVAVSHSAYVPIEQRGCGVGQDQHKKRLQYLQQSGHAYILCTVDANNEIEIHILVKNGWKLLDTFISPCTCHSVYIYGRSV